MSAFKCITAAVLLVLHTAAAWTQESSAGTRETIKKISFHGAKRLTEKTILGKMRSRPGLIFDNDVLRKDLGEIVRLYAAHNLFLVRIDSVKFDHTADSSQITLRIFLTEGRPIEIGEIVFEGNRSVARADLLNVMNASVQAPFDPEMLERDLDDMVSLYEDRGFPFARIVISEFRLHAENARPQLSMTFSIEENQPTILSRLDMAGLKETRPPVLIREMRLPLPRPYRRSEVRNGLAQVRKFSFITDIREGELTPAGDSAFVLTFDVEEGPSNTVDGIAGYVPKTAVSKGYFTGFANLSFQNLFGTARRLDARWQKRNRYTQEFQLAYMEPWVMNYPVNLGGSVRQLVQDTIYTEREWTLDGQVWVGANTSGLFGFKIKSIIPANAPTGYAFNIPTADHTGLYVGMEYDTRDSPYNPRRGVLYNALAEYGKKNEHYFVAEPGAADTLVINDSPVTVKRQKRSVSTQKLTMRVETIFSMTRRLVLYNAVHGAAYKSPQSVVPYSEQIRFGGLKSVRGYTEDFFNGTRVGWDNFEIRWLTSPRSRLFAFADLGYYFRREWNSLNRVIKRDGWPFGYGFGIRFETGLGLFALDFGLGKKDSFSEGKIHFGIASRF